MAVRIHKPTSPGRRLSSVADFSVITKHRPEKSLIEIIKKKAGRNNQGKITVRHRGGGVKRYYRIIDFKRRDFDALSTVQAIEYDPNRSSRIALLSNEKGVKSYIIAPLGLSVGDQLIVSKGKVDIKVGNRTVLANIPVGTMIHALELKPGMRSQLVRSAGTAASLMALDSGMAHVRLPSGEIRMFSDQCMATIGQVGNVDHQNIRWGKAGRMRLKGWRPTVRGKAMNPVDHPHGGGEGNQPIGLKGPKTPQGRPALGVKTRKKKKYSNVFILKSRSAR